MTTATDTSPARGTLRGRDMTTKTRARRRIARIFEDIGGLYVCDDSADCLDARGRAYATAAEARSAAWHSGYTHAVGSGVGSKTPVRLRRPACADERAREYAIEWERGAD
jgi:hypothetical protein